MGTWAARLPRPVTWAPGSADCIAGLMNTLAVQETGSARLGQRWAWLGQRWAPEVVAASRCSGMLLSHCAPAGVCAFSLICRCRVQQVQQHEIRANLSDHFKHSLNSHLCVKARQLHCSAGLALRWCQRGAEHSSGSTGQLCRGQHRGALRCQSAGEGLRYMNL